MWSWQGGQQACVCFSVSVCVCVCWNLWTTAVREVKHIRGQTTVFFPSAQGVVSHRRAPSAVESSKWQQRIDLLLHERDGLLLRAPGDNRVEDHSTHHGERLWTTCVAFRPLYLPSRLSLNGSAEHVGSLILWHFPAPPTDVTQCSLMLWLLYKSFHIFFLFCSGSFRASQIMGLIPNPCFKYVTRSHRKACFIATKQSRNVSKSHFTGFFFDKAPLRSYSTCCLCCFQYFRILFFFFF